MNENMFVKELLNSYSAIMGYARMLTKEKCSAEDLFQDTMEQAFMRKDSLSGGSSFYTWVIAIMRNIYNHRQRDDANMPGFVYMSQMDSDELPCCNSLPDNALNAVEVVKMIRKMPVDEIGLLYLFAEGMEYSDLVREFNMPMSTVKYKIFLARKQLKRIFGNDDI